MVKKWKVFSLLHIWNIPYINYKVNNLLYLYFQIQQLLLHVARFWIGWYFVSLWEDWKGVSRMERKKELILPYLERWNSFIFVHLVFQLN